MDPEGWIYTIPLRLRSLVQREAVEGELDEELRDHLARKTAEGIEAGLTTAEARRRALVELGGLEQSKEECRDARGLRWLEDLRKISVTDFASCASTRGSARWSCSRWRSVWERTPRSSRFSTACCCGRCQRAMRKSSSS